MVYNNKELMVNNNKDLMVNKAGSPFVNYFFIDKCQIFPELND